MFLYVQRQYVSTKKSTVLLNLTLRMALQSCVQSWCVNAEGVSVTEVMSFPMSLLTLLLEDRIYSGPNSPIKRFTN